MPMTEVSTPITVSSRIMSVSDPSQATTPSSMTLAIEIR
jgi:hypothetical protein